SDLSNSLAGIGEIVFDPEKLQEVGARVAQLDKKQSQAQQLKGQLDTLPVLLNDIGVAEAQLKAIDTEVAEFVRQRGEIGYDVAAFDSVKKKFIAHQQKLEETKAESDRTGRELEIIQKELEMKLEELARLDKAVDELKECRTEQFYVEGLVRLFGDFRKYTIGRIRPRLAELSSDLLTSMSGGKYSLVELDNDYNLQIMDCGKFHGVERFSGGEKDLASLCLRLAISSALTESAGLDKSFVILDEVFGSQDSGRRDLIFEALANLRSRFSQIFLVTHLEELKNKVESLIEVVPTAAGYSEVVIDGNPA
ncbi:MAG: hypothetical protein DRP45_03760, partial [Candidatus Zixiibacteriota bacterium]